MRAAVSDPTPESDDTIANGNSRVGLRSACARAPPGVGAAYAWLAVAQGVWPAGVHRCVRPSTHVKHAVVHGLLHRACLVALSPPHLPHVQAPAECVMVGGSSAGACVWCDGSEHSRSANASV